MIVDTDVILIAKLRYRQINKFASIFFDFCLALFHYPARIDILLCCFRRIGPNFAGQLTCFDGIFLFLIVMLMWGFDGSIHQLSAQGNIATAA
ncbi:MAG: hypothetical protein K2Y09_13825 [Nitrosomonas sp.]|uniref:hypothetical protein n=1 Tax=Nitrosomonas sp. TaxID=42353 RepID=UPI001DF0D560|nr:hypothetical protein [Nitrosomonas sp.]MBX9896228.1 hypothetical protein [Nitrosomonas sp.]